MKITIVGAGNMGGAIARGLLASEGFVASDLTIAKFAPSAPDRVFAALGCASATDPRVACLGADMVIIAVKPWLVDHIAKQMGHFADHSILVSVAGGVSLDVLGGYFSGAVFRVIPNTAAAVGQSITFVCSQNANEEQKTKVRDLFARLGVVMEIDQDKFEAATALGSCGVAFAMRYMRASIEGAVELGLTPALAQTIVAQTVRGAAAILQQNDTHPEIEVDRVTTAGGTTIKGLNKMEQCGFSAAVIEGLKSSKSSK